MGEIGDPVGRLAAGVVGNVGMLGIEGDWLRSRSAGDRKEIATHSDPCGLVHGEIGRGRALLRRDFGRQCRTNDAGQDAAGENLC